MSELRAGPGLRWARAGLTAVVACSLGLFAHVLAGGQLPAVGWTAAGVATVWVACAALLGRPASRLRLIALVGGGQAAFHLLLTALAGHGGPGQATSHHATTPPYAAPVADAQDRRGSFYDLTMAATVDSTQGWSTPHWLTHVVEDLTGPHAFMALAHLAAAAGVACWLAVGEQAVWVLVCLLGANVLGTLARVWPGLQPLTHPDHSRPSVRRTPEPFPVARPRRSRLQRRGPPPLRSTSLSPLS